MKDDHVAVLLESIESKIDRLAEAVGSVKDTVGRVDQRLEAVETQTALIPVIKAAVTDQRKQLADHDQALRVLKRRAA